MKHINNTYILAILISSVGILSTMMFTSCGGDDDNNTATSPSGKIVDGHEYVDLGLSVKWATCNVGANNPWETGDYFAWGETEPKTEYSWATYKWSYGMTSTLTKYCFNSEYGIVDNKETLELDDDAAYVNWGSKWRIPTDEEWLELYDNCFFREAYNDVGSPIGYYVFKAKTESDKGVQQSSFTNPTTEEGKKRFHSPEATYNLSDTHIFIPFAGRITGTTLDETNMGHYWSSTLSYEHNDHSLKSCITAKHTEMSSSVNPHDPDTRSRGYSIRAVYRE